MSSINQVTSLFILMIKSKKNTLCNYVSYYYQQSYQDLPIRYLHRLDRDTTGLVMFCKCALLQPYFDYMIASKKN